MATQSCDCRQMHGWQSVLDKNKSRHSSPFLAPQSYRDWLWLPSWRNTRHALNKRLLRVLALNRKTQIIQPHAALCAGIPALATLYFSNSQALVATQRSYKCVCKVCVQGKSEVISANQKLPHVLKQGTVSNPVFLTK